jgi:hypothetical protein
MLLAWSAAGLARPSACDTYVTPSSAPRTASGLLAGGGQRCEMLPAGAWRRTQRLLRPRCQLLRSCRLQHQPGAEAIPDPDSAPHARLQPWQGEPAKHAQGLAADAAKHGIHRSQPGTDSTCCTAQRRHPCAHQGGAGSCHSAAAAAVIGSKEQQRQDVPAKSIGLPMPTPKPQPTPIPGVCIRHHAIAIRQVHLKDITCASRAKPELDRQRTNGIL